ncbi:Protein KBP-like protein, partial [Harpegnathos saltator]
ECFLSQSMLLLEDKELDSNVILVAIITFNILSYINFKLEYPEKSVKYSYKALELYMSYTKGQDNFPSPIDILTILDLQVESNTVYLLDRKYMDTLRSLIILKKKEEKVQIDIEKIVMYMHKLLKKQLGNIPITINHVSWAIEAIRLAEYFLSCNRFIECKNHLVIASITMERYYNNYYKGYAEKSNDKGKCLYTRYKSIISFINTCWVKYGLTLLFLSKKQLLIQEGKDNFLEANIYKLESTTQSIKQSTGSLMFTCTDEEYQEYIYITEDNCITNYNDAKLLFVNILQLLNKIKVDISISDNIYVYTEIAQYISKAYKYLAFYEHDKINQIKLQKRRIDVLEECLKTLNVEDNEIACSFIWFELAVINSTIVDIKIEHLKASKLSPEELVEIDQLVNNSVTYFQLYI